MPLNRFLFISTLFTCQAIFAQSDLPSVISSNTTLKAADGPFYMKSNSIIQAGVTLEVEAGVRVISTGNFTLTVNGTLRAQGTEKNLASFESMTVDFTATAAEYNPSTGEGCRFIHTRFTGFDYSSKNITTAAIDLLFDKCVFGFGYYSVTNNSTNKEWNLWITNSKFYYKSGGYPVQGTYAKSSLHIIGNYFEKLYYLYMGETNEIKNNYFVGGMYTIYCQYYTKYLDIQCNYFKQSSYALYLYGASAGVKRSVIMNNHFDSCGYVIMYNCIGAPPDSFDIRNNNFVNAITGFVVFSGTTSAGGTFNMLNIGENFWNTTDTTKILKKIFDFRQNPNVPYKIDVSNILSAAVPACWPANPDDAVGVNHLVNEPFHISPNPATEMVNIQLPFSVHSELKIYSVSGEKISECKINGDHLQVSAADLPSGIYVLQIPGFESRRLLINK